MKHSRRYGALDESRDRLRRYTVTDAVGIVKNNANAKFDETVEVAANLGVDPRHADQQVRGTVVLSRTGRDRPFPFWSSPRATRRRRPRPPAPTTSARMT